jgi:hypothetical protein
MEQKQGWHFVALYGSLFLMYSSRGEVSVVQVHWRIHKTKMRP